MPSGKCMRMRWQGGFVRLRPCPRSRNASCLELIGEFDAVGAIGLWTDFKSVAHWLAWACSMTPGVAREHVRVATALRRMSTINAAFQEGVCRIRRFAR
jgi:hypothetical protein